MNTILEQTKQQSITIRVVFDGAPYAGKTTAAYSLGEALGSAATTPADDDGRTVWFDYLAYKGGRHDGESIRVELVTVPGQEHLSARRRHLLEWGDVVVFIADTGEDAFPASVAKFAELRSDLATSDMPIVVMANKRDLDDAVALDLVRAELDLSRSEPLVEAVATSGDGIREAFIHAVRLALAEPTSRNETSSEQLLAEMRTALTPASLLPGFEKAEVANAFDAHLDELPPPPAAPSDTYLDHATDLDDQLPPPPAAPSDTYLDHATDLDDAYGDETHLDDAYVDHHEEPTPREAHLHGDLLDHHEDPTPVEAHVDGDLLDHHEDPTPVEAAPTETDLVAEASNGSRTFAPVTLRDVQLNADGIHDGAAVVLLAEHWRMLVEVANGRTDLPLSDGSDEADIVVELASWGLIIGDDSELPADSKQSNERYRELRELRRTTRQP